jgi:hypothetical protein
MKRYLVAESQIFSIVEGIMSKNILSEIKKDPRLQLWNVFRLITEDGITAYTITSSNYPDNVLGPIISAAKLRWRREGDLGAGDTPDGYLYQYILSKIVKEVKENPQILKSKTLFSQAIRKYFTNVEKINQDPLNKMSAEAMKRQYYQQDKESFKYKGAALFGGSTGRPVSDQPRLTKTVGEKARDVFRELLSYDEVKQEKDGWSFNDYAHSEMLRSDLPVKIKDSITTIKNDPSNQDMTSKENRYRVESGTVVANMFNSFKNLIDKEEYPEEDMD